MFILPVAFFFINYFKFCFVCFVFIYYFTLFCTYFFHFSLLCILFFQRLFCAFDVWFFSCLECSIPRKNICFCLLFYIFYIFCYFSFDFVFTLRFLSLISLHFYDNFFLNNALWLFLYSFYSVSYFVLSYICLFILF